jgi:uncharacterized membrane protein YfcA
MLGTDISQILNLLIVLSVAACIAGFMAGLLGVGGGLVMVPALYYAFSVLNFEIETKMHLALGTSLAIIIPTSIMSTRTHMKYKAVDFGLIKSFGIYIIIGVLLGTLLASKLKTAGLVLFFSIFAFLVGLFFIFLKNKLEETEKNIPKVFKIIIGNLIGFISVPLGIGGGSLSVPFMRLFGYDMRKAIGTSAAIGIVIAITGTVSMIGSGALFSNVKSPLNFGYFNLPGFLVFVPITMLVAPLGARVVHTVSRSLISRIFGIYLIIMSIKSFQEYLAIR